MSEDAIIIDFTGERTSDFLAARRVVDTVVRLGRMEMYPDLFECLCEAGFASLAGALMTAWTQQALEQELLRTARRPTAP